MFAVSLIEVQRRLANARPGRAGAVGVLRIGLGLAVCPSLLGCVTDASQTANLSAAVGPGEAVAASPLPGGLTNEAATMVAKARALAFADPGANRPEPQIDLAMLATRSNPGATRRLDGPPSPGPTSEALSPDETMARLKALSQASSAESSTAGEDDRSRDILARLRELSHQPAAATDAADPQTAPVEAPSRAKPVSPEDIMRRMRELTAAKPDADAGVEGTPQRAAGSAFGGLGAFVAAPDMTRTPAVDRAVKSAAEADQ